MVVGCAADTNILPDSGDSNTGGGSATAVICGKSGLYIDLNFSEDIAAISDCTRLLGTLRVGDSPFVSIDGLESIDTIDEMVVLFRNPALASLQGLSGLAWVGDAIHVRFNSNLPNLTGFESLVQAGSLLIEYNDVLTNLDGLQSLQTVAGDLIIVGNPLLSQTEAESFANGVAVGGTIRIEGNGS